MTIRGLALLAAACLVFLLQVTLHRLLNRAAVGPAENATGAPNVQHLQHQLDRIHASLRQAEAALGINASGIHASLGARTGSNQAVFPPGNEATGCVGNQQESSGVVAAIVMVAFNRPDYLRRAMASLLLRWSREPANSCIVNKGEMVLHTVGTAPIKGIKFPLFISQDGSNAAVAELAKSFGPTVRYLQHIELVEPIKRRPRESLVYYRIANHYQFIFRQLFDCFQYPSVLVVEDDMEFAVDFLSYFEAGAALMTKDTSLYCVSAWNDHGQDRLVKDSQALYRSDFFPGLGWMTNQQVWQGLRDKWPDSYWDDWMRMREVRQGRQCIRPEVCRTYNFGQVGASQGQFYRRFLKPIKLNEEDVDWMQQDLTYLDPVAYEQNLNATLASARTVPDVATAKVALGPVKLMYDSQEHFEQITGQLKMLREWKDGVPRAGYHGVVTVAYAEARVFIAPSVNFKEPQRDPDALTRYDSTGAVLRGSRRRARERMEALRAAQTQKEENPTDTPP